MYNNPYGIMNNSPMYQQDLMNLRERIDRTINQMSVPSQNQQAPITQNFQLAGNLGNNGIKYVNSKEDVANELVFGDTLFVNKELSILFFKNASGQIRSFSLKEIIELDEKDQKIMELEKQIEEMRGMIINAKHDYANVDESTTITKSTNVSNDKSSKK